MTDRPTVVFRRPDLALEQRADDNEKIASACLDPARKQRLESEAAELRGDAARYRAAHKRLML